MASKKESFEWGEEREIAIERVQVQAKIQKE